MARSDARNSGARVTSRAAQAVQGIGESGRDGIGLVIARFLLAVGRIGRPGPAAAHWPFQAARGPEGVIVEGGDRRAVA